MTDSASITVTNHRLRKAMAGANNDDLKTHMQKMGAKIKSELTLHLGKITKIYPYLDKCEVEIMGNSKKETCLIAHNILSEEMNVSGFPDGRKTHEKSVEVIIPSETIYGVVLDVDIGGETKKIVVSYVNIDRKHTKNNATSGEYKMQVGKNVISLTDKYINIKSDNLFINGLPYTEAYTPFEDDNHMQNSIFDSIYPVGSIYLSVNEVNPSTLFGGTWEQIQDKFLLGSGSVYENGDVGGGQAHNNMPPYLVVYMWKRIR